MSLYDAYVWLQKEQAAPAMANTFSINDNSYVTTEYSLTETLSLTNSSWNYFGFANNYDTSLDVTQNVGTVGLLPSSISPYHSSLMVDVKPSEYSIHRVTEQRVSTMLSGLASAGGVFSVIIAIQTLLFGFRPNSPWGIVHRWSFGRQRRTLRDQLRDGFNTDNAPVPMATRVRGEYHLLPIASGPMAQLDENKDDQDYGLELKKVQERIQLMEDLFKTYYIDDEIFQKLNEARENKTRNDDEKTTKVKDEAGFSALHQEDEEALFYKRD
jgi:hypothetical protein